MKTLQIGITLLLASLSPLIAADKEKITTVTVQAHTTNDNKEDAQFECIVKQGQIVIHHAKEGAGVNWDDGDDQEFNYETDTDLTGQNIEIICALQDGTWGRRNHWNCRIKVIVATSTGRRIVFEKTCAFRTSSEKSRHEINFGSRKFGS